jgi:hypothetical protein
MRLTTLATALIVALIVLLALTPFSQGGYLGRGVVFGRSFGYGYAVPAAAVIGYPAPVVLAPTQLLAAPAGCGCDVQSALRQVNQALTVTQAAPAQAVVTAPTQLSYSQIEAVAPAPAVVAQRSLTYSAAATALNTYAIPSSAVVGYGVPGRTFVARDVVVRHGVGRALVVPGRAVVVERPRVVRAVSPVLAVPPNVNVNVIGKVKNVIRR